MGVKCRLADSCSEPTQVHCWLVAGLTYQELELKVSRSRGSSRRQDRTVEWLASLLERAAPRLPQALCPMSLARETARCLEAGSREQVEVVTIEDQEEPGGGGDEQEDKDDIVRPSFQSISSTEHKEVEHEIVMIEDTRDAADGRNTEDEENDEIEGGSADTPDAMEISKDAADTKDGAAATEDLDKEDLEAGLYSEGEDTESQEAGIVKPRS